MSRIKTLDLFKGLIIFLMMIDHTGVSFAKVHHTGEFWAVGFPTYDNFFDLFTRMLSHPCAPGFIFSMGISIVLYRERSLQRNQSEKAIFIHFLKRGLLLFILCFAVVNLGWYLASDPAKHPIPGTGGTVRFYYDILSTLGIFLVLGNFLSRLRILPLVFGIFFISLLYHVLMPDPSQGHVAFSVLTRLLLVPGQSGSVMVPFPLLPWLPHLLLGIIFGKCLLRNTTKTLRHTGTVGLLFILIFLMVRAFNGPGNIHTFENYSLINFFNLIKYPPSFAFFLLFSGINFLFIKAFTLVGPRLEILLKPIERVGQAPLFAYVVHLYVLALLRLLFQFKVETLYLYPLVLLVFTILYFLNILVEKIKLPR